MQLNVQPYNEAIVPIKNDLIFFTLIDTQTRERGECEAPFRNATTQNCWNIARNDAKMSLICFGAFACVFLFFSSFFRKSGERWDSFDGFFDIRMQFHCIKKKMSRPRQLDE